MTTKELKERMEPEDTAPPPAPPAPPPQPEEHSDLLEQVIAATKEWITDQDASARLASYLNRDAGPYWCSISPDTPINKARRYNALAQSGESLKDRLKEMLLIEHVAITVVRFETEQGELLTTERVTLIDTEGQTYSSVGKVPVARVRQLLQCMGDPPWSPPLPLRIEVVKSKRANRDSFGPVIDMERWTAAILGQSPLTPPAKNGRK